MIDFINFRCTPRAVTWRPTRGPTLERSPTSAAGKAATGSLPALTSWPDTCGNTLAANPSSATCVTGPLPGVTTSVCTWRDTRKILGTYFQLIQWTALKWRGLGKIFKYVWPKALILINDDPWEVMMMPTIYQTTWICDSPFVNNVTNNVNIQSCWKCHCLLKCY